MNNILKDFRFFPHPFSRSLKYDRLFISNCLPIVACSERNNGSSWDVIAYTRETAERHWQVGNDAVLKLTCLRKITGVYAATLQTQYTPCYQGECVKEGQLDIDVICEDLSCPSPVWSRGGLSSSGTFFMKFFIWRGLFHNNSVCAVYLKNASRCWRVSDGMYNCSPYGRDLTSVDERENKLHLERHFHAQRQTREIVFSALG